MDEDDTFHGAPITVGLDDTAAGRGALAWAAEEAEARGGTLTICHVRGPGAVGGPRSDLSEVELTDPVLARQVRQVRQRLGGGRVSLLQPIGDVTKALVPLSRTSDLMVVGGHSSGDPLRHRIASQLAAWSRCPLVIVRPVPEHHGAPFAGHVVVGVDGTPAAQAALRFGLAHAHRHHLPLAAIAVDTHTVGDYWYDESMLETHFVTEPAPLELLAHELDRAGAHYGDLLVKRGVFFGDPVTGLRHAALGAALVVLGRHGDLLPGRLRLGSVGAAFAAHAECALAVVPESSAPVTADTTATAGRGRYRTP